jgi:hypothetical protein
MKATLVATAFVLWGLDALVRPANPQPCASAVPLTPKGEVRATSQSGVATLIGFSAFTSPASPPKKYRRKSTTGTVQVGMWAGDNCAPPPVATSYTDGGELIQVPGDPFYITWSASLTPISGGGDGPVTYQARTSGVHVHLANGTAEPFAVLISVAGAVAGNADDFLLPDGGTVVLDPASGSAPYTVSAFSFSLYGGVLPTKPVLLCAPLVPQYRDVWNEVIEYDARDPAGATFLPGVATSARLSGASSTFPFTSAGVPAGAPREADYAGGIRETLTPERRELTGTDQCVAVAGGRRRVQGGLVSTLSVEDTEEDALGRAMVILGDSRTAFRTKRANGFSFAFADVQLNALFEITCPGEYAIVVHYTKRAHGTSEPVSVQMDAVETGYFPAGPKPFSLKVAVDEKDRVFNQFDTDYTIEKVEARLLCPDLPPGGASASLGSVRIQLGLGRTTGSFSAAQLLVEAAAITPALYTPDALSLVFPTAGENDVVRSSAGVLRQVLAPQTLADIVVLNESAYEVRFYAASQVGARDPATKLYALNGTPYVLYRFENPDPTGGDSRRQLRLAEVRGTITKTTDYGYVVFKLALLKLRRFFVG